MEKVKKRSCLRWLSIVSASCVLILLVTLAFVWPYFWIRAAYYETDTIAKPATPVMTMQEYDQIVSTHPRPYQLRYSGTRPNTADNQLLVFGISHHTTDPQHDDIKTLETLFEQFDPTICLIEGRLGIWIAGYDGLISQFAESGALAYLARRNSIDCYTLELPLEEEMRRVADDHNHDHVVLFYVLRPYFGQRRGGPIDDPENAISESLRKRTGIDGINSSIGSVEDIDRVWKEDFADLPDWRDCDDANGWPGKLNDVGSSANSVRNQHWLNILEDLINRPTENQQFPRRVMMVVGCSHAVRLQPALDSMFTPDSKNSMPGK